MSTLQVQPDQDRWTDKQIAALRSIGLENATNAEMAVFLSYCQRTGLDPFARQIYMIARGGRYTIQASIDGLRIVAQRSGEYAGQTAPMWANEHGEWFDVWLWDEPPAAAKIGVYRRGFAEPLVSVARFDSYCPLTKAGKPSGLWATMPDVMIAKVAEALALRRAFPNDLSGIYSSDEMEQADVKSAVQGKVAAETAAIEAPTVEADPVPREPLTAAPEVVAEVEALLLALDAEEQTIVSLREAWTAHAALLDVPVQGTTLRVALEAKVRAIRDAEVVDAEVVS